MLMSNKMDSNVSKTDNVITQCICKYFARRSNTEKHKDHFKPLLFWQHISHILMHTKATAAIQTTATNRHIFLDRFIHFTYLILFLCSAKFNTLQSYNFQNFTFTVLVQSYLL